MVKQLANQIQLYFREKGYKDFVQTLTSYELAEEAEKVIAAQRIQKIFVDYSASWKNTLKGLIERYIKEECPKHKGKGWGQMQRLGFSRRGFATPSIVCYIAPIV